MRPVLALSTLLLGGCCCGLGGGGGGGFSERIGSAVSDKVGEKVQEAVVEGAYEASTGHDLDISGAGQKIVAETDEGVVTTYINGTLPDGFDWPLPSDAKVTMGTRLDPKDPSKGGVAWVVTYETAQDWKTVAAALQAEGEKRGYKVTSTTAAMKQALEEAKAQGVTIDAAAMGGMGSETGDMLSFESTDPNKNGGATIDGSTPGKTSVMLTVH